MKIDSWDNDRINTATIMSTWRIAHDSIIKFEEIKGRLNKIKCYGYFWNHVMSRVDPRKTQLSYNYFVSDCKELFDFYILVQNHGEFLKSGEDKPFVSLLNCEESKNQAIADNYRQFSLDRLRHAANHLNLDPGNFGLN